MIELKSDLFVIQTSNNISIIYSPLRGAAFHANSKAEDIIREYIKSGNISEKYKGTKVYNYLSELSRIEVEEPQIEPIHSYSSDVMFILSQICNMNCSYCYAQKSRSKETISMGKIKSAVDYVCKKTDKKNKSFSFIGGGEPLSTWELFEWSINYIKEVTEKKGFSRRIGLTTNGTLLNEKRILILKQHSVTVNISFDILPEIQNVQRPLSDRKSVSFELVHNNIKMLLSYGLVPRIRSTITNKNVKLMPQMVKFVIQNYPEIKFLHFEPVTDTNDNSDDFYKAYIISFMEARSISNKQGIYLKNSLINSLKRIRTRFCNGEFCITPSCDIVSCHRISSDVEECFESFKYGQVTNDIEIDTKSLNDVLEISEKKSKYCSDCFAKWHCAGGCPMYRAISTEKEQLSYCTFFKNFVTAVLNEQLAG